MFRTMMYLQWQSSRWAVLGLAGVAATLPVLASQFPLSAYGNGAQGAQWLLDWVGMTAAAFPAVAAIAGGLLALLAWTWDHEENHVYALTLPVSRSRYALLRGGVGVIFAMVPVLAVGVTSLVATASIDVPVGLKAYPLALTGRFALAVLVSFGAFFAIGSGTRKTTYITLGVLLASTLLLLVALPMLSSLLGLPFDRMVTDAARVLPDWPTPFRVFVGNWMLIDV